MFEIYFSIQNINYQFKVFVFEYNAHKTMFWVIEFLSNFFNKLAGQTTFFILL